MFEIYILLTAAVVTFYCYITRNYSYWKKRNIKYEKPIPIFGNLWDSIIFKRSAGEISRDVYYKYPNEAVVGMYHFDSPVLLLRDPNLAYKVYVHDFHHFADNAFHVDEDVDPVFARNMFFQKGDKWKRTRKMLTPAFTIGRIKAVFDMIASTGDKLKAYIEKNPGEMDLKYLMTRFGSEVVATCGLGINGTNFEEDKPRMVTIGQMIFEPSFVSGIIQYVVLLLPKISKLFSIRMVPKEVPIFFDEILRNVIEYRQKIPESNHQDMVQYWIELKKKSEDVANGIVTSDVHTQKLENDDILNGCVTFFIESYETTSMVTSFAMHHLALDKELQKRAQDEVDNVYANCNGKLTFEAINDMPLFHNIILEVLRLYPAVLHAVKTCTKTYAMDIGKDEPLIVEEGTTVIVPNLALSHDSKYFEDPEKFNPDRFDEMNKDDWKKGVFMPFGEGPRMCIGMRLAYVIMKIALISVLRNFDVVPSKNTPKEIIQDTRHFISRNRAGLYAKLVRRE